MSDEMYTTRQAAIYLGITESDVRLAVREGKLKAWTLPMQKSLLMRKSDLSRFRDVGARNALTRQLHLFSADSHDASKPESANARKESNAA
jgi:excisionase family DNA binding protein